MRLQMTTMLVVALDLALRGQALAAPQAPPKEQLPIKDFTSVDPVTLGVIAVQPKKDPKTGFIVGGKNPTKLIRTLPEINGRSIADLEKHMRPGAESDVGSEKGFLGKDEALLEVLAADNRFVVDEAGLTHQELAEH